MKKRGSIFTIAAVLTPVITISLLGLCALLYDTFEIHIAKALICVIGFINPKAPFSALGWAEECVLFFFLFSFCASAVLLYSGLLRFVNKNAESVYLTPRLSLWVNCTSAAGSTSVTAFILMIYTMLLEDDVSRYPNRIFMLNLIFAVAAVAFLSFAVIYLVAWKKAENKSEQFSSNVIILDIFRGFLLTPGYGMLICIAYRILLIFFSDAFS